MIGARRPQEWGGEPPTCQAGSRSSSLTALWRVGSASSRPRTNWPPALGRLGR
jgi:hypothetical protein